MQTMRWCHLAPSTSFRTANSNFPYWGGGNTAGAAVESSSTYTDTDSQDSSLIKVQYIQERNWNYLITLVYNIDTNVGIDIIDIGINLRTTVTLCAFIATSRSCASPPSQSVYQILGGRRPFQPATSEDPIKDIWSDHLGTPTCRWQLFPSLLSSDLQESTDVFVKAYESARVIDHAVNVTGTVSQGHRTMTQVEIAVLVTTCSLKPH